MEGRAGLATVARPTCRLWSEELLSCGSFFSRRRPPAASRDGHRDGDLRRDGRACSRVCYTPRISRPIQRSATACLLSHTVTHALSVRALSCHLPCKQCLWRSGARAALRERRHGSHQTRAYGRSQPIRVELRAPGGGGAATLAPSERGPLPRRMGELEQHRLRPAPLGSVQRRFALPNSAWTRGVPPAKPA